MRFVVSDLQANGFRQVTIEHRGEELIWETKLYGKVNMVDATQVFNEINGFFETLTKAEQTTLMTQYREIKEALDGMLQPVYMEHVIKSAVCQIYQIVTLARVERFMNHRVNLYVPADTRDAMDPTDRTISRSKTYLVDDYRALAVLTIAVRPMVPVWGEYIEQIAQGNQNLYKEMDAVGLLSQTALMEAPVCDKLLDYMTTLSENYPISMTSLMKGLSSEEVPSWLMSLIMVRRLAIVPVTTSQGNQNIVANIRNYVLSQIKPDAQGGGDGQYRPKKPESDTWEDEDNKTSFYESYKVKQEVTDGDVILNEVYVKNMARLAQKIDPSIDLGKLQISMQHLDEMASYPIEDHQIHLIQWVCGRVVSGRATKHHMVNARVLNQAVVTQALLWHWGFIDIAMLMTVRSAALVDAQAPMIASTPRTNARFKEQQIEALDKLYPHRKQQKSQRYENQYNNVAINDVAILNRQIFAKDWRYMGPPDLKAQSEHNHNQQILAISSNIKSQLVDLVIRLAQL